MKTLKDAVDKLAKHGTNLAAKTNQKLGFTDTKSNGKEQQIKISGYILDTVTDANGNVDFYLDDNDNIVHIGSLRIEHENDDFNLVIFRKT